MDILFAADQAPAGSGIGAFLPIILMFAILYFLIFRPQMKQRKVHAKTLEELKKGDKILTRGGIYGKIVEVTGKNNNKLIIDVGGNTKITVARAYVAGLAETAPDKPVNE
ncbi:MAG: preprotein translocase subunit YajC [Fidelibacterota bacterium]